MNNQFTNVIFEGTKLENYQINKTGDVRNKKGQILKQTRPGSVMLSINGKRQHVKVSKLLMSTFKTTEEPIKNKDTSGIHYSTNESYYKVSDKLKELGVSNYLGHCTVHDPRVSNLNPFSTSLTDDEKQIIREECSKNIFYFIGECLRIPDGVHLTCFELDIANLSAIWAFKNNISTYTVVPPYNGRKFSQFAIIVWSILFRDLPISYITKININEYRSTLLRIIDFLPDYIKDADKVRTVDLRLINNPNGKTLKNRDLILIDDFETIPNANDIFPLSKDSLVSINTLVGDPDEVGFNPAKLISSLLKWDIKFLDLTDSEIRNHFQGGMMYIEYPISEFSDDPDEYYNHLIRKYNYDHKIIDRLLFLRRKTYVDETLELILKDTRNLTLATRIRDEYKSDGYIANIIQDSIKAIDDKDTDFPVDMIELATIYNIIKDIDLGDNFDIDLTDSYESFEEFAIKTFGMIDADAINELIFENDHISNKITDAWYSITGEYYKNLYPNIKKFYDTVVEVHEAFKNCNK